MQSVENLICEDELELDKMGRSQNGVAFVSVPEAETSFNFWWECLYIIVHRVVLQGGSPPRRIHWLDIPVQVIMDEFANIALPDSFENILSTCRKRTISIMIILQNMSQLKKLFESHGRILYQTAIL